MTRRRDPQSTRRRLLRAAFEEFRGRGFRAADLETILRRAGVTKGALYHHFPSKLGLGYAVVDEILRDWILDRWLAPVARAQDPLRALAELAGWAERTATARTLARGSPLNQLAQELAAIDEGFSSRLAAIYRDWRQGLVESLRRGQLRGVVAPRVEVAAAAAFIVAVWEGSVGLARGEGRAENLVLCRRALEGYLESLRA